jgi:hypothetical protein
MSYKAFTFCFSRMVEVVHPRTLPLATVPPPSQVCVNKVTVAYDMCGLSKIVVNWDETLKTGFFVA